MAEDFPSPPNAQYSSWEHPITGAKYYWNQDKLSWMKGANAGTQVYTGPNSPVDYDNKPFVPNDGDMWWDTHMLELRVWHRPMGGGSKDPGRWISSTNPQMALNDPNRNSIIGTIELIEDPGSYVVESEETIWEVERVVKDDSEKYVQYEWIVNPPSMVRNETEVPVFISNKNSPRTSITWPPGTSYTDADGNLFKYSVRCQVKPQDGEEDRFIEKWQYSETRVVYPTQRPTAPLDYMIMTKYTDATTGEENYGIAPGNLTPTQDAVDKTLFSIPSQNQFLMEVGTNVDYPEFETIFSSVPSEEWTGAESVSTSFTTGIGVAGGNNVNGYIINARDLTDDAGGNVDVHFWKASDDTQGGILRITA